MIRGLKRYAGFFITTFFSRKERKHLLRDAADVFFSKKFLRKKYPRDAKEAALRDAADWLVNAQQQMRDDGFGTYYIMTGWTSSYPETSGYIIPTLLDFAARYNRPDLHAHCIAAADWLLSIQKESGGWQSLYIEHNRPEVVFNTGQVLRGLSAVYGLTGDRKYLDSCIRACNWLCDIQEPDGSWMQHAFMNRKRVYDSYVSHPMLMIWQQSGIDRFRDAAVRNLDWIISSKQHKNGWFEDCDNTIRHNDRPILHTISYTIDGLINSGIILDDARYIAAGQKAADKLLEIFSSKGWLPGRFDASWNGSQDIICTGCAQISIVWLNLYRLTGAEQYRAAAERMNDQLVFMQQRGYPETKHTKGALTGSYPLWGRYEPFGFPNWATKYFADSLMMELEIKND